MAEAPGAPTMETLQVAMDAAWRDHQHARDQTWRALQVEAALAAGLLTVDVQFGEPAASVLIGCLVVAAAYFGIMITLNHRRHERRKFIHIMNCEEILGLHRSDIIPLEREALDSFGISPAQYALRTNATRSQEFIEAGSVSVPCPLSVADAFRLSVNNTAAFILRMHIAIMVFAVILVALRVVEGTKA